MSGAVEYLFNHLVSDAASTRAAFDLASRAGHHWIPFGSLVGLEISDEALRFWGAAKSGVTMAGDHLFDDAHRVYNAAVRVELAGFAKTHGIDLATMTKDQAMAFTNHILSGTGGNSTIKSYVAHISASAATRAAQAMAGSQLGRASLGLLRFIGGVGGGLLLHTGEVK